MTGGAIPTGGSTQAPGTGSLDTAVSPANIAQLTGGATGASPMSGMNPQMPSFSGIPGSTATSIAGALQSPQWLKGMQLGTQISQMGQPQQARPSMQLPQRPMGGQPQGFGGGGMQTGAVPGAGGMMPQAPQSLMGPASTGVVGSQNPSGINPQILQLLMRGRSG